MLFEIISTKWVNKIVDCVKKALDAAVIGNVIVLLSKILSQIIKTYH